MKSLVFLRICQFILLALSLFLAMKHNVLFALFLWALSSVLSFTIPQKYRSLFR